MTAEGLYVYAVVPPGLDSASLGRGIDGAPLELLSARGRVAAVAHRHGEPPYSGSDEAAQRRVLEHGEVIERCWAATKAVLPMGFNVIVSPGDGASAEDRLVDWLDRSAPALVRRLEALRGLVELRVEISLREDASSVGSAEVRELEENLGERPPGVQRLLRRRLESLRRASAEEAADRLYPEYRRRLARLARDLTENVRGHPPEGCVTVLNVAVLADEEDIPRLGTELGDIEAEEPGVRVTFLGPWPPFSFADVPDVPSVEWTA
ncbi:GvpL/GvpF family gas vesicle protein [Sinomonas susongensis]|uniref:GvpL/GvpF family gas vesicle protein n=1 Tax=Sinomonas susongensis TaxID=1324851 RepID=UPI001109B4DF|nr:GvpL/GvpF family gas vesicle protein [Sinomonas susongensis]